jgi:hypothetical protein
MDKATIRPLVFDALRRTPQTHLHAIDNEVRQKADDYERGDALLVQETVWELLVQGVLAPGKNSLNLNLPFVHVTEYGQRCLEEGWIVVYDPDGYATRLRAETAGAISSAVLENARDALLAFQRGLFRASLVLLSRAAFELLREVRAELSHPSKSSVPLESELSELEAVAHLAHSITGALVVPAADRDSTLGRLLVFPSQCRMAYTLSSERHATRRAADN